MVILRELKREDAPLMLEWMHDAEISKWFLKNMLATTLDDAYQFCNNSKIPIQISNGDSLHFAIVEQRDDEYLGTVSLKSVDIENGHAEFAICLRKKAQGKGIAQKAVSLILRKAFEEYKLHKVYLNVLSTNIAAINLYKKCGFRFEGEFRDYYKINGYFMNILWYGMTETEYSVIIET